MKRCGKCEQNKDEAEFHKRKNGLQSVCKECRKEMDRHVWQTSPKKKLKNEEYRDDIRQAIKSYKAERGCKYCPEKEPVALDFHHTDDNKEFSIGSKVGYTSKEALFDEIAKCIVICANCHRKLHAGLIEESSNGRMADFESAHERSNRSSPAWIGSLQTHKM